MRPVEVRGLALWTPACPSWSDWRAGVSSGAKTRPGCDGIPSTLLRGASVVTCVAVEALRAAALAGGADLSSCATVFGSTFGEIQTAVALAAMMREHGLPSPMRFKNSVHNASGGIASIAHSNHGFSTSISAGGDLVGACLLEAIVWLDENGGEAVVVLAEEELPSPLAPASPTPTLGVAFHLRSGRGEVTLENLQLGRYNTLASVPERFVGCAVGAAVTLAEAVEARRVGPVALSIGDAPRWSVDVVARR